MNFSKWSILPSADKFEIRNIGYPNVESTLLSHRGINTARGAQNFLNPPLSTLHDPNLLLGMNECVQRLRYALNHKEIIGVFGDFDTDGLTGTALLTKGLRKLGAQVYPYIPHRTDEGHGISLESIEYFKERNVGLLVTVDCGVTSFEEISIASESGIETIVTDHHAPEHQTPNAVAIINPSLPNSPYPFPYLTGVGTAFKVLEALYKSVETELDDNLFALVALGTISDVGNMRDENRSMCRKGIGVMRNHPIPGIDSLIEKSGLFKKRLSTEDLSFGIIPRLNVAGRLGHAKVSLQLLLSKDSTESNLIADKLETLNRERQRVTERAFSEARKQVEKDRRGGDLSIIFAGKQTWPAGILGLIAGRLAEEYRRPAVVASGEKNYFRASARSIPQFNMIEALRSCGPIFEKYGGHPMAAGFTINRENLRPFREKMSSIAAELLDGLPRETTLEIEHEIPLSWLNRQSISFLHSLEPYGLNNPAPIFMTKGVAVLDAKTVGKDKSHLKLTVEHCGTVLEAIAFRQGHRIKEARGDIDVAYSGNLNYWNGNEIIQLNIEDFRLAV